MCEELNVPFLGSLPLDPAIARYCDEGKDFVGDLPNSPAVEALNGIVKSNKTIFNSHILILFFAELVEVCDSKEE